MGGRFVIDEIAHADLPAAVSILCAGFPHRPPRYWHRGLARMAALERQTGVPKYGYALLDDGKLSGVVLTLPSTHQRADGPYVQVNLSSWCALPAARGHAARALFARACSDDALTYTDLSAAPQTLRTITSLGFRLWSAGQMVAVGTLRPSRDEARVVPAGQVHRCALPAGLHRVLTDHERFGCLTMCLQTGAGPSVMIFVKRRIRHAVPMAQLIYCDDLDLVVDHWWPIWRWLSRRGFPAMLIDCSGPVTGLAGRYVPGKTPKYVKGRPSTKAVDHTYSEMCLFGF